MSFTITRSPEGRDPQYSFQSPPGPSGPSGGSGGGGEWVALVPTDVAMYLAGIHGPGRMRRIARKAKGPNGVT